MHYKIYLHILEIEATKESANNEKRLRSTKNSNSKCKSEKHKEVTWSWERREQTVERSKIQYTNKMKHCPIRKTAHHCVTFSLIQLLIYLILDHTSHIDLEHTLNTAECFRFQLQY